MNEFFIRDICEYLADKSATFTFGTGATNLKAGELPRGTDGVFAVASPSPEPDMDTLVEYHNVDFWARNKNTSTALDQMREIYELFHQNHHYVTTNFEVYFSHALGQIEDQDRDLEGGKLLRLSIMFITRQLIS